MVRGGAIFDIFSATSEDLLGRSVQRSQANVPELDDVFLGLKTDVTADGFDSVCLIG